MTVFACKKETNDTTIVDSKIKVKQAIVHDGIVDTITYIYNGENVEEHSFNGLNLLRYVRKYTKNGNRFNEEYFTGTTKTHEGFSSLNAQGFIDTSRITYIPTMTLNNTSKRYYDANGYVTRDITNYNSYINDYKKFYTAEGNNSYWIFDRIYPASPASNTRDSIVFEFDFSKLLLVPFEYALQERYGKPNKHLVTKRLTYNTLDGNVLKQTREYQNEVDANGLVIKRITTIYNQPGNVVQLIDTTYYSYYMD